MGLKTLYNEISDRIDLVAEDAVAFFSQQLDALSDIYDDLRSIDLGGNVFLYIAKYIPNYENVIRHFTKRTDNTLIDKFGNDAQKILPVSTILATSIAEFSDLSGITITSYSGDQLLSISGNNIISSGTGFVFDLLLSDGTFIPFLHLKTDVSGNENHILNITDIGKEYRLVGSSYLQDKGAVERNPELFTGFTILDNGWVDNGNGSYTCTDVGVNVGLRLDGICSIGSQYSVRFEVYNYIKGAVEVRLPFDDVDLVGSGFYEISGEAIGTSLLIRSRQLANSFSVRNISVTLATPEIIPNTPTGQPAYPIVSGDTFIAGGGMMNLTDCLVRMYELGDTDPAKLFFDLSNTAIWNGKARQDYYDPNNTGDIHTSILKQAELYLTFEAAYKYRLWSKINSNGVFEDIFLYANQLQGENICLAKRYVGVGETYDDLTGMENEVLCKIDILKQ